MFTVLCIVQHGVQLKANYIAMTTRVEKQENSSDPTTP